MRGDGRESCGVRVSLAVGGQTVFVTLTDLLTGDPPAFLTTILLGAVLALGLEYQSQRAARSPRDERGRRPGGPVAP